MISDLIYIKRVKITNKVRFILTLFAFGANVAFERVHLNLDALVLAFGLRRFAPIDEQNDDGDEDQEDTASSDASDGLRWKVVRLDDFVAEIACAGHKSQKIHHQKPSARKQNQAMREDQGMPRGGMRDGLTDGETQILSDSNDDQRQPGFRLDADFISAGGLDFGWRAD